MNFRKYFAKDCRSVSHQSITTSCEQRWNPTENVRCLTQFGPSGYGYRLNKENCIADSWQWTKNPRERNILQQITTSIFVESFKLGQCKATCSILDLNNKLIIVKDDFKEYYWIKRSKDSVDLTWYSFYTNISFRQIFHLKLPPIAYLIGFLISLRRKMGLNATMLNVHKMRKHTLKILQQMPQDF